MRLYFERWGEASNFYFCRRLHLLGHLIAKISIRANISLQVNIWCVRKGWVHLQSTYVVLDLMLCINCVFMVVVFLLLVLQRGNTSCVIVVGFWSMLYRTFSLILKLHLLFFFLSRVVKMAIVELT